MRGFKCVMQHDTMQCGVACLSMICNHFGLRCTIEELSEMCPATTEGGVFART